MPDGQTLDWVLIYKFKTEPIGAIGFLGNEAVAIVAFFDDKDGNQDGEVSLGERVGAWLSPTRLEGKAVAEVAMQARVEPDVILRDPSFQSMAVRLFLEFARHVIIDGIYATYFQRGVSMLGRSVVHRITGSTVKRLALKKSAESAVKQAFRDALDD